MPGRAGGAVEKLNADELAAAHDRGDFNMLWLAARPLVKFTIKRMMQRGEVDPSRWADGDLKQEGMLAAGLAVRSWNTLEGRFSTWVVKNIRGYLLNYLQGAENGGVGGPRRTSAVFSLQEEVFGIDDTDDEDEGTPKQDLLSYPEDEVFLSPETATERANAMGLLDKLGPADARIARLAVGLDDDPRSFLEIAKRERITEWRVRSALDRLRRLCKAA